MAAGVLMMNADVFVVCLLGFMLNGFGIGLTLPSVNMLILELNPTRPASALSVLNFCWGVGAILSKPFVDTTTFGPNILPMTLILASPLLAGAVLMVSSSAPISEETPDDAEEDGSETGVAADMDNADSLDDRSV